jgi:hypothetical protein
LVASAPFSSRGLRIALNSLIDHRLRQVGLKVVDGPRTTSTSSSGLP